METAPNICLPQAFAELEPFVAHWSSADPAARAAARDTASEEQLKAFHAAMSPRIEAVLNYLDTKVLAEMDSGEAALLNMSLAFVHVVLAVEMQTDAEPLHRAMRSKMKIVEWPAEVWNG